ncbi:MAG: hypothetical protein U5L45_12445 [Saprospiraceae bacterium]|nr:hypothetical protein [Saprospiraceae bacterium]
MREENIIKLRPVIELNTAESMPIETFQNTTLRPILKLQHDLLFQVFRHYITSRKNAFLDLKTGKRAVYIHDTLKADLKFKNRLLGIIIGHFTVEEYAFFQENETELVRRITELLIKRLQSMAFS